jgi:hypothetical protein
LNITGSKSFTIQGGIVKYGNKNLSYYFIIVNGTGGASLSLLGVEIEFVGVMNSTVLILGGQVTLEDVKIKNQLDTMWVSPLIFADMNVSSVNIDVHSCKITDCKYKNSNSVGRSAFICFKYVNNGISLKVNITFCKFCNNSFNLVHTNNFGGAISSFESTSSSSSFFFFFFFFF